MIEAILLMVMLQFVRKFSEWLLTPFFQYVSKLFSADVMALYGAIRNRD